MAPVKTGADAQAPAHRPLGDGVAWRRVAAGFLAQVGVGATAQLGVGVPRGPEIFASSMRMALEAHRDWVDLVCNAQTSKMLSTSATASCTPPHPYPFFSWLPMGHPPGEAGEARVWGWGMSR